MPTDNATPEHHRSEGPCTNAGLVLSPEFALKQKNAIIIKSAAWLTGFALFAVVVPILLILALPSDLKSAGIATVTASPVIEYMAISVGIGLGISPLISFLLTVLPCIGLCMLVFGLLGVLEGTSVRARKFLERVQKRVDKFPKLKRYGAFSSFVFVMFLGIYIGPGIAVLLGWSRIQSAIFIAGGISCITLLIGLGTMGVIDLFFI